MGIRFACHVCNKKLNIKSELAGKRGVCPACSSRFRIPLEDALASFPVETRLTPTAAQSQSGAPQPESRSESRRSESRRSDSGRSVDDSSSDDIAAEVPLAASSPNVSKASSPNSIFDGESTWYVRPPSGGQYGPAGEDIFREWITEGRVAATALVWRDGWAEWREAIEVLPQLTHRNASPLSIEPRNHAAGANGLEPSMAPSSTPTESPGKVYGNLPIGAIQRKRFLQRAATITVLSLVAIGLVAALLAVAGR